MKTLRQFSLRGLVLSMLLTVVLFGCKPKDSEIQQNLTEQLSTFSGVSATVTDGVVTLTGQVADDATRANAETEAAKVKGVESIVNNITVTPPPPPVVINTDDSLRNAVNSLVSSQYKDVKVQVNDGVVTLTGSIKRSELATLMQKVNEMRPKRVENQLQIK